MSVGRIAVLGAGTMGHGIAFAAIHAGYETRLFDPMQSALDRGRLSVERLVAKAVELGKIPTGEAGVLLRRLAARGDLREALAEVDFVIEAAPERIEIKLQLFAGIEQHAPPEAIVTSNTSALSITEMAATLSDPGRVAGMHFFNPVHKMKLVEIVQALETVPATLEAVQEVAGRMGKETVLVRESPGFITTRVNASLGNEAFYMLMEGVASPRDIDKALKLGLNIRWDPSSSSIWSVSTHA